MQSSSVIMFGLIPHGRHYSITSSAFTLAGGSSVYASNVLQRCLRDVHVTTQHLMVAPKLHETLGRLLLGLEADVRFL